MSGDHQHNSLRAGARHQRPLVVAFALVVVFMVVEVVAGFVTGSLALLSDAGHMATDAVGLGMALAAITAANRADRNGHRTYGLYRLEILAALANAVLLFGVAGYVLYEAFQRFQDPPAVLSGPMLIVAILGLVVNLVGWRLLREGARES
ncbi:MAG: cation transporter, partial [Acidimicrobiia bacterium]|nr:cation transporter [Acidimicrobiia bacterium]